MPTFVALLRGVNVGKAKRVPMAELRALLAELGYSGVATLLNSGNAVFRAAKRSPSRHAADIRGAILRKLDVDVPVIVKTTEEFDAIVSGNPMAGNPFAPARLLVAFTPDAEALAGLAMIGPLVEAPERFEVGKHAAYLHCSTGILESRAGAALLGKLGKAATTRNWATVLKLQAMAHERYD